jgi:hypothetical protein
MAELARFDEEHPSTVPPPTRRSGFRGLREKAPVDRLTDVASRFRQGDFHGAMLSAMHALDSLPSPVLSVSYTYMARAPLSSTERLVVALVDGTSSLEEIFDASGLGLLEGIEVVSRLLELGVIALGADSVSTPETIRAPKR